MPDDLDRSIEFFKAGDRAHARALLLRIVGQNPSNERAWGWLSNVAETTDEKVRCLEKVIQINPANTTARKMLDELQSGDWASAARVSSTASMTPVPRSAPAAVTRSLVTPPQVSNLENATARYLRLTALASALNGIGGILMVAGLLIICCPLALAFYWAMAH